MHGEMLQCDMRDFKSASESSMWSHKKPTHEGKIYDCDQCDNRTPTHPIRQTNKYLTASKMNSTIKWKRFLVFVFYILHAPASYLLTFVFVSKSVFMVCIFMWIVYLYFLTCIHLLPLYWSTLACLRWIERHRTQFPSELERGCNEVGDNGVDDDDDDDGDDHNNDEEVGDVFEEVVVWEASYAVSLRTTKN